MTIERVRNLSALTLHFATDDIKDNDGKVLIAKGQLKVAHLEYVTSFVEDGNVIPGTSKRETATADDLTNIPEISDKLAASLIGMAAEKQRAERALEAKDAELQMAHDRVKDTEARMARVETDA